MNPAGLALLLLIAPANPERLPPLSDLGLFPSERTAEAARKANDAFQEWVNLAGPLSPRPDVYAAARREAEISHACWYTLELAHFNGFCETRRRQELDWLRRLLGDEAYYAGQLPPPVPVWRFQRIN